METKSYKKTKTQTARRSVTPRKRLSESDGDNSCVVCAQPIVIYAVGHCDHYICFKCSTKIRLLCEENLCPVCRKDMKTVVFTKKKKTFEDLNTMKLIKDTDYNVGIFFSDPSIMKEYKHLLEHKCPVCPDRPPDRTFEHTKAHLRKEHTLFYCEICLEHNRTFTSECKTYSRKDLGIHKRVGDPDDSSHRGHPLCVYCDVRYLDDDKLFHHLRTTHFFCHLCDHGETNEFYGTYLDLRKHFRAAHFLCEEGDCINEEFTSVFATKLDFKAHCASIHRDNRSKQQLKKDRQIDLGFQYAKRDPASSRGRGRGHGSDRPKSSRNMPRGDKREFSNAFERETDLAKQASLLVQSEVSDSMFESTLSSAKTDRDLVNVEPRTMFYQADFPGLSNVFHESTSSEELVQKNRSHTNGNEDSLPLWSKGANVVTSHFNTNEDFPSLPKNQQSSTSSAAGLWNSKSTKPPKKLSQSNPSISKLAKPDSTKTHQPKPNMKQPFAKSLKNDQDFPVLTASKSSSNVTTISSNLANSASSSKQPKSSKPFKKNLQNNDDFPRLTDSKVTPSAQWFIGGREIESSSVKKPKSSKPKSKNVTNKQSNSSSNATVKNNANNNKKSTKPNKKTTPKNDDFVNPPSANEVVVGRGSSKHIEIFESFSEESTPNISLITAEQKSKMNSNAELKRSHFKSDFNDFPSLSSLSSVSAPPGFASFTPMPVSLGDLMSAPSDPSVRTSVKPPPGFEGKRSNFSNQTESPVNDFPSLSSIYSPQELACLLNLSNEQAPSKEFETMQISKNNERSKKKKKEFKSKNPESDFPSLPFENNSSSLFHNNVNKQPVAPPTQRSQVRPPPTGTSLNLANIFNS